MRTNFTILSLFLSICIFAQSNWQKGYEKGFSEGYCYNDIGCVSPPAPPSIQNVGDDYNSYKDGYNKGFSEGQKAKSEKSIKAESQTRERYKTAKPEFIDFNESKNNLKIDYSLKQKMDERYSDLKYTFESALNRINDDSKITKNYNRYLEIREKYLNKINDAMKLFNRNKIEILKSEDLTGELWWNVLTIGSDFNREMENSGF